MAVESRVGGRRRQLQIDLPGRAPACCLGSRPSRGRRRIRDRRHRRLEHDNRPSQASPMPRLSAPQAARRRSKRTEASRCFRGRIAGQTLSGHPRSPGARQRALSKTKEKPCVVRSDPRRPQIIRIRVNHSGSDRRHRRRRVRRPRRVRRAAANRPCCGWSPAWRTITSGEIAHRRSRRQQARAERARHRHGVPELRALSAHDGRARTWRSRSSSQASARTRSSGGWRGGARRLGSTPCSTATRGNSRAASGSASRWAARSSATRKVFLFDEPLSNLDAKLRVQMRAEIKRAAARVRTTTIYVTHDQVEAMTMADRIVVMNARRVEQVGAPLDALRPTGQRVRRRLHRLAGDEPDQGNNRKEGRPCNLRRRFVCRDSLNAGRMGGAACCLWCPAGKCSSRSDRGDRLRRFPGGADGFRDASDRARCRN